MIKYQKSRIDKLFEKQRQIEFATSLKLLVNLSVDYFNAKLQFLCFKYFLAYLTFLASNIFSQPHSLKVLLSDVVATSNIDSLRNFVGSFFVRSSQCIAFRLFYVYYIFWKDIAMTSCFIFQTSPWCYELNGFLFSNWLQLETNLYGSTHPAMKPLKHRLTKKLPNL